MNEHPSSETSLTAFWAEITDRPITDLRVMQEEEGRRVSLDAGPATAYWFEENGPGGLDRMTLGPAQGGDTSCEEEWPVYLSGDHVADLRDEAGGYVLRVKIIP